MIRIDEIYNNIFLPSVQSRKASIHWFEPFGTTEYQNLCNQPLIDDPAQRIIFWDQEPLHRERFQVFIKLFQENFSDKINGTDPITLITSELGSEDIEWACDTYNLKMGYYFFHAWAALDWYRGYDRALLYRPFKDRTFDHTFLCPNNIIGGKRKHRLELLCELVDRELITNNLISFPDRCPYENRTVAELCQDYDVPLGSVDLPLTIDIHANHANNSHKIDMWSLAEQSLLHVVTETVYYGRKNHLTEKTFKPIVMQQPFVLVSCQGSLEYLRRYGFQTFDKFWNEDYDDRDDSTRIMRVTKLLADLDGTSAREKKQLQEHLAPVVEHNFRWFYSREFENLLWNELNDMISRW